MNMEDKLTMDQLVQSSEHLCYVRCNFCNTVLAVGLPCKRMMDTVTVKCGHCSNLSFITTRPTPIQLQRVPPCPPHHQYHFNDYPTTLTLHQSFSTDSSSRGGHSSLPSPSSPTSLESPSSPKARFVCKPPEKKHRPPSACNRFMKEEIQRIKAANPEVPHREAFSAAAKNWARYPSPSPSAASGSGNSNKLHVVATNKAIPDFAGMSST